MIKAPTVLVLGAGASAHLGYPIGKALRDEVCSLCRNNDFKQLFEPEFDSQSVDDFRIRLSRSGFSSVDAFLEENSDLTDVGKFAIAACLKRNESEDSLFPPHDSGWYETLFQAMHCRSLDDFASNHLSVVTFNYDRTLECYLHNLIQNRYRVSSEVALKTMEKIPIIHVHGILGAYPEVRYELKASSEDLIKISKNIKIIHELIDDEHRFCSAEFERAHFALKNCRKVIFLGFGFHEPNVRRFRFFTREALAQTEMIATNVGLSPRTKDALLGQLAIYGFEPRVFPHGLATCETLFRDFASLD